MALPFSDTFSGGAADLSDPPYHNVKVASNMATNGSGSAKANSTGLDCWVRQDVETFGSDQYSRATLAANLSGGHAYLYLLLCSTGDTPTQSHYWFWTDGAGDTSVRKHIAGASTTLASDGSFTAGNGDVIEFRKVGTTLSVWKNGTEYVPLRVTDSSLSTGTPGFGAWNDSDIVRIGLWEADNVSAGPTYTLTAAAGSYALTGTAAALRKASKMAAAAASFALTGTAAALTYTPASGPTHTLAAAAGDLALTASPVNLTHGRKLTAAAGSYALTGTAAALRKASKMAAAAASFAITGAAAGLRFGHALIAAAGAYALTGTAAALRKASNLIAGAASFVISGTAAALSHGGAGAHTLSADAGTFTLTGAAAALKKASKMAGAAASFVITGASAGLSKAKVMAAAAGAYVQTGTAAAFATTRALVASAAVYLLTGAAATLSFFQSNAFYLSPWLQAAAAAIMRALGNTDVTIDYGGGGAVAGVRAHRRSRGFDPAIGDRSFMSDATEFLVEQITAPASLVPGVTLLDETNLQQFKVHRVIPNRGGLLTIYVKNP